MFSNITKATATKVVLGAVPAFLISVLVLFLAQKPPEIYNSYKLPGRPLATYTDLYPIRVDERVVRIDERIFARATEHFLNEENPKAAADLIYLGQANNVALLLTTEQKRNLGELIKKYEYTYADHVEQYRDNVFSIYKDIVDGIGMTLSDTGFEIVLHDTRNPLKSIVAIQNPISGRRLGDSTTNFGIELIKDYSIMKTHGSSYVSYGLTLKDGRNIKSSTIPLYDDRYGLIGFICLNIDTSKLTSGNDKDIAQFIEHFTQISSNNKINELIDNTTK